MDIVILQKGGGKVDYIKREDALSDAMCVGISCQECPFRSYTVSGGCMIANYIESIPAADVVERNALQHVESVENALDVEERKTGKWVSINEYLNHLQNETGEQYAPSSLYNATPFCNQCWTSHDRKSNFCPNCGADMREDDNGKL